MADWTTLIDAAVSVGGLPSGTTVTALRDNPIAIAEGAVGAPRIADAALDTGAATTAGIDWVVKRTPTTVDAVGSYALARIDLTPVNFPFNAGSTVAGSSLKPANTDGGSQAASFSGTWRVMGFADDGSNSTETTLCLRIS
jgi:hypothetical protein